MLSLHQARIMKNFDPNLLVSILTLFCLLNIVCAMKMRKQKKENLRDQISSIRIRKYSVVSEMAAELFPLR